MSTSDEREPLKQRIERLMNEATRVASDRSSRTTSEMVELLAQVDRFEVLAETWLKEIAIPRLGTLALAFPNSVGPARRESGFEASVAFAHTDEFPVVARLEIQISHDLTRGCSVVTASTSIIPILMEFDGQGSIEMDLGTPSTGPLEAFLDDRIVRFVSDYLRVREPDSFYQRSLTVTDPVCGMTFPRARAAGSAEWEGCRYYFCVDHCRERFEAEPLRFAHSAHAGARCVPPRATQDQQGQAGADVGRPRAQAPWFWPCWES